MSKINILKSEPGGRNKIVQLIWLTMKTKKSLFRVIIVVFFLYMLSFTSCELMGCYSCRRTNDKGKTEKFGTCSADEADQLRSEGWTCEGGW